MADLSIDIGGIRFKNPIMAAGATPTLTVHNMAKCIEAGASAIEWKSVSDNEVSRRWPRPANRFLDLVGHRGVLQTWETGFIGLEESLQQLRAIKPVADEADVRLMPNLALEDVMDLRPFGGPAPEVSLDQWCDYAEQCEREGADVLVVNGPCPVVIGDQGPVTFSWFMDWYDEALPPIIETLKGASSLPVWVKNNREFYPQAKRFAEAITKMAPDVVQAGASIQMVHIDIEHGLAFTPGREQYVKGNVNWAVAIVATNTPVPVVSAGNLQTWRDCVERIMCGARGLLVATEVMHRGYKVFTEMIEGIDRFMNAHGYARLDDMVGVALPSIQLDEDREAGGGLNERYAAMMSATEVPKESVVLRVVDDKCNGCERCLVCMFEAITMQDRLAVIDQNSCERCGVCWSICPTRAIELSSDGGTTHTPISWEPIGSVTAP